MHTANNPAAGKAERTRIERELAGERRAAARHLQQRTGVNGDEELELIRSAPPIDVLITDLAMPGMSGRTVADAVSQLSPSAELMFVSGYVDEGAASASFAHFLQKPFTPTALAAKVRDVLDARMTGR